MRELEGTGIVHIADSDCNPKVVGAIKEARLAKSPREYIDYLSGGKPWTYATKEIEQLETEMEIER